MHPSPQKIKQAWKGLWPHFFIYRNQALKAGSMVILATTTESICLLKLQALLLLFVGVNLFSDKEGGEIEGKLTEKRWSRRDGGRLTGKGRDRRDCQRKGTEGKQEEEEDWQNGEGGRRLLEKGEEGRMQRGKVRHLLHNYLLIYKYTSRIYWK